MEWPDNQDMDWARLIKDLGLPHPTPSPDVYEKGLQHALMLLPLRYRFVIRMRYKTSKETFFHIGNVVGVSGSRILQVLYSALRMLRHPYYAKIILSSSQTQDSINDGPPVRWIAENWENLRRNDPSYRDWVCTPFK